MGLYGTAVAGAWYEKSLSFTHAAMAPFSMSLWVNLAPSSVSADYAMIDSNTISGCNVTFYDWSTNTFLALAYDDSGTSRGTANSVTTTISAWNSLVITVPASGGVILLYRNGVLADTSPTFSPTSQTFAKMYVAGGGGGGGGWGFDNKPVPAANQVAEFLVVQGTLQVNDVQQIYAGVNPLSMALPGPILAYHPLRNDLFDYGPGGVPLVAVGGATTKWSSHPPVAPTPRRPATILRRLQSSPQTMGQPARFQRR